MSIETTETSVHLTGEDAAMFWRQVAAAQPSPEINAMAARGQRMAREMARNGYVVITVRMEPELSEREMEGNAIAASYARIR